MKIGFTGTRHGMTNDQADTFYELVHDLFYGDRSVREFHHGDCIGADAEAHEMVFERNAGVFYHLHPCNLPRQRAYMSADFEYEEKPPLKRNHDIVDASEVMIATPRETKEKFRGSGTWATIRYTRSQEKKLYIIWPDGSIKEEF